MPIRTNNWDVETYRNKLEKGFIPPSILMLVMKIQHMAIFALNISTYVIGISPIVCPILIYYIHIHSDLFLGICFRHEK